MYKGKEKYKFSYIIILNNEYVARQKNQRPSYMLTPIYRYIVYTPQERERVFCRLLCMHLRPFVTSPPPQPVGPETLLRAHLTFDNEESHVLSVFFTDLRCRRPLTAISLPRTFASLTSKTRQIRLQTNYTMKTICCRPRMPALRIRHGT